MKLTLGATSSSQISADDIKAYALAMLDLTAYNSAIEKVDLIPLIQNNVAYTDFCSTYFPKIKAHAQNWLNSILPNFTAVPQSISNYYGTIDLISTPIIGVINSLIQNPADAGKKAKLVEQLSRLQTAVQAEIQTVAGIQSNIQNFTDSLTTDLKTLEDCVNNLTTQLGVDQNTVADLNSEMVKLKKDLKNWSITVGAMGAAGVIGGICCGVGGTFIAAVPVGPIVLIIGIVVAIAAAVIAAVGSAIIHQDQQDILEKQKLLDDVSKDVTTLNMVNQHVQAVVEDNEKAFIAIAKIAALWNSVDTELNEIVTEISDSIADAGAAQPDFNAVMTDFNQALIYWTELNTTAIAIQNIKIAYDNDIHNIPISNAA